MLSKKNKILSVDFRLKNIQSIVMNRIVFVIAFSVLISSNCPLHAQVIKGALIGGFNLSQVDGDEVYGFNRIGFNVGAAAIIPLGEKWSVSLENSYSQKGAFQKKQYNDSALTGKYNLRLNYVEVPLLVHFTDKEFITFGAGFSWARLVKAKEIEHNGLQPPYSDSIPFNDNDFNAIADIRFRIWKKLKGNIRYSYSLKPIREREFENLLGEKWMRKQYNNVITFRLMWIINEKRQYQPQPDDQ